MKVLDLVVMGRFRFKGILESYSDEDYELSLKYLEYFNISHLASKLTSELSGGERQLAWICQTLIQDCPVILLDEPGTHLDLYNKRRFYEYINNYNSNDKIIVMVTHDLEYLKYLEGQMINFSGDLEVKEINEANITCEKEILEQTTS